MAPDEWLPIGEDGAGTSSNAAGFIDTVIPLRENTGTVERNLIALSVGLQGSGCMLCGERLLFKIVLLRGARIWKNLTPGSVTFTCCSPRMRQRSRRQLRAHIGSSEEEAKCSGKVLLPAVAHSRPYQRRLTLGLIGLNLRSWGDRCLGQLSFTAVESENSEASWSTGYS